MPYWIRPKDQFQWLITELGIPAILYGVDLGFVIWQPRDERGANEINVDIRDSEPCFGKILRSIDALFQQFSIE